MTIPGTLWTSLSSWLTCTSSWTSRSTSGDSSSLVLSPCSTVVLRIGYYGTDNRLVTDPELIKKRYLRGWFVLDLISSIPYQQIYTIVTGSTTRGVATLPNV